jgi:hypothetical protein
MAMPRDNSSIARDRASWAATEATFEFGRYRVLLRQRQLDPHRDQLRLPVHCRSSFDRRLECLSAPDATGARVNSKVGFPTDFSPTAARLVCPRSLWQAL